MGGCLRIVSLGAALGRGVGYLSQHGWISNSIVNYESVTGAGEMLQVNSVAYPSLFWVLKGGSNSYGIVTRFDLKTWEKKPVYSANISFANGNVLRFASPSHSHLAPNCWSRLKRREGPMRRGRMGIDSGSLDRVLVALCVPH